MSDLPPYGSNRELGAYDQLPSDVKDQLPQLLGLPGCSLPPSAKVRAEEHSEKAGTPESLMEKLKVFGDNVVMVDQAFERVKKGLGEVDAKNYKDSGGNIIPKLQSTWVGYQDLWTTLLWDSRAVATKTEAYIKDFLEVIVPEVEAIKTREDLDDARLDLELFIKRRDPEQHNSKEIVDLAQNYSRKFVDLIRKLGTFKDTFVQHYDLAITEKRGEIIRLVQKIGLCITVVMGLSIVIYVGALARLRPIVFFAAAGVAIIGANAISKLTPCLAQLKDLQGPRAVLEDQKTDILDICGRLDCFAAIWELVWHDAESIKSDLSAVGDQGSKRAFMTRIGSLKASYTKLRDALNLYATTINLTINLSNVKKHTGNL